MEHESIFKYLDCSTWQEKRQIAENLKRLYNRWYQEEQETFAEQRRAAKGKAYNEAQKRYIAAVSKLGAIQAVFAEMGIEFDGLFEGV